jgi:hypothetical protein
MGQGFEGDEGDEEWDVVVGKTRTNKHVTGYPISH